MLFALLAVAVAAFFALEPVIGALLAALLAWLATRGVKADSWMAIAAVLLAAFVGGMMGGFYQGPLDRPGDASFTADAVSMSVHLLATTWMPATIVALALLYVRGQPQRRLTGSLLIVATLTLGWTRMPTFEPPPPAEAGEFAAKEAARGLIYYQDLYYGEHGRYAQDVAELDDRSFLRPRKWGFYCCYAAWADITHTDSASWAGRVMSELRTGYCDVRVAYREEVEDVECHSERRWFGNYDASPRVVIWPPDTTAFEGRTVPMTARASPATNPWTDLRLPVTLRTSDSSVVVVTADGRLEAVRAGTALVFAELQWNGQLIVDTGAVFVAPLRDSVVVAPAYRAPQWQKVQGAEELIESIDVGTIVTRPDGTRLIAVRQWRHGVDSTRGRYGDVRLFIRCNPLAYRRARAGYRVHETLALVAGIGTRPDTSWQLPRTLADSSALRSVC